MSKEALLPCFKCGKTLLNVCADEENQPDAGTEFTTYGHYGSTFWDSFYGEQLVLNICDGCLREHAERLAQHKRFLPVVTTHRIAVGKHWVDRPMVPYCGKVDDGEVEIEPEEIGTNMPNVEWPDNADELREYAVQLADRLT